MTENQTIGLRNFNQKRNAITASLLFMGQFQFPAPDVVAKSVERGPDIQENRSSVLDWVKPIKLILLAS